MTSPSATEIFAQADERGQAGVPCFDVAGGNVDIIDALSRSLAESDASAFLSSTPRSISDYLGMDHFVGAIAEARERFGIVVTAHLDHAEDPRDVESALAAGVRSVMFDGSSRLLSENISESRRLVTRAHAVGATLEAEVGVISGKEDSGRASVGRVADVGEVLQFVSSVEPDLFAPAIGTIHGRRGSSAEIAWESAEAFSRIFDGPLVLHGTTGLAMADVQRLVSLGYRKVNYATAIRDAFVAGVAGALQDESDLPRPQHVLANARRQVRGLADDILAHLRRQRD